MDLECDYNIDEMELDSEEDKGENISFPIEQEGKFVDCCCHRLPWKWTDLAIITTLSAYISHGLGLGYCCSINSHAVIALLFFLIRCMWTLCHTRIAVLGFVTHSTFQTPL
jgi:hypothetical protein